MNPPFLLDRAAHRLSDVRGRLFEPATRVWHESPACASEPAGVPVDALTAARWLQRESGSPLRIPVGVIGPREATPAQLEAAEAIGRGLAQLGFTVICGGRQGVMEAACRGASGAGGLAIGMLPEPDPSHANPHVGLIIATGIGEARNALIARAAFCLVAIGDSYGTLSEVALGRQFGKLVVGLEGAAQVDGVFRAATPEGALARVAAHVLGAD